MPDVNSPMKNISAATNPSTVISSASALQIKLAGRFFDTLDDFLMVQKLRFGVPFPSLLHWREHTNNLFGPPSAKAGGDLVFKDIIKLFADAGIFALDELTNYNVGNKYKLNTSLFPDVFDRREEWSVVEFAGPFVVLCSLRNAVSKKEKRAWVEELLKNKWNVNYWHSASKTHTCIKDDNDKVVEILD